MRRIHTAAVVLATSVGFVASSMALPIQDMQAPIAPKQSAGTILTQNLTSDEEQKLGIPRNSANPDYRRGRGIPSEDYRRGRGGAWEVEQGMGRRYGGYESRLAICQERAHRRGLDGREFRRFVRYCLDR